MKPGHCLNCGYKIPLIIRIGISYFVSAECPKCHSYMRFSKKYYVIQTIIYILIFPMLGLFEKNKLLGFLGLLVLLCLSILIASRTGFETKKHRDS